MGMSLLLAHKFHSDLGGPYQGTIIAPSYSSYLSCLAKLLKDNTTLHNKDKNIRFGLSGMSDVRPVAILPKP